MRQGGPAVARKGLSHNHAIEQTSGGEAEMVTPLAARPLQASLRSVGWHGKLHQDAISVPSRRRLIPPRYVD